MCLNQSLKVTTPNNHRPWWEGSARTEVKTLHLVFAKMPFMVTIIITMVTKIIIMVTIIIITNRHPGWLVPRTGASTPWFQKGWLGKAGSV